MMIAADPPMLFWSDSMEQAARMYNQLPHSSIGTSPYQKLTGQRPSAKHWKPFVCKAFVYVPKANRDSMSPAARPGILLGCLPHGIFRVLTEDGRIFESLHVTFDETKYPGRAFLLEHAIFEEDDFEPVDEDWEEDSESDSGSTSSHADDSFSAGSFTDVSTEPSRDSDSDEVSSTLMVLKVYLERTMSQEMRPILNMMDSPTFHKIPLPTVQTLMMTLTFHCSRNR